jgi:hypothetical protein
MLNVARFRFLLSLAAASEIAADTSVRRMQMTDLDMVFINLWFSTLCGIVLRLTNLSFGHEKSKRFYGSFIFVILR